MSDRPPRTILFVDDSSHARQPLANVLRQAGYHVQEAASGREALRLARARPHLVLLDVHLPDVSGFEICRQLKADPDTAASLILMLSGRYIASKDKTQGLEDGADAYLVKPVEPAELVAHVKALLRLRPRREEGAEQPQSGESLLRHVLEHAPVVVVIKDVRGRYLMVNPLWEQLFQVRRADALGFTVHDIFPAACADVLRDNDRQVIQARRAMEFEETVPSADGPHTYLSVKYPLLDEQGEPYAVCAVSTDITARKQAEEALREAEERYRTIFENGVEGIYQSTASGYFLTANPAMAHMLGFRSPDELLREVADIGRQLHVEPEAREEFRQLMEKQGTVQGFECQLRRRDGSTLWASLSGRTVRDRAGGLLYFQGLVSDVSERKKAERQLQLRVRQQAVVAELGQRALASTDVSALLTEAAGVVAGALEVDYCRVLEQLPDGAGLQLRAASGWPEAEVGVAVVPRGTGSQAGYTLLQQGPVLAEDLQSETRFKVPDRGPRAGVASSMSVLIPGSEGPFGVLLAETTRRRTFIPDDVHFLQAVANVLATAIERKRAEEVLLAGRLEMGFARKIQQKLFPTTVPRLAGLDIGSVWRGFEVGGASYPAEAVGGDYYDYVSLPDGSLGVAIGDVSGHGPGPALLMAELRAYLRGFAQMQTDVGVILRLINQVLAPDIVDDRFITLLLGRLDPRPLTFRYASAGHPTGYVLDSAGAVKQELPSTGIPLGIFPEEDYAASAEVALRPGDLVVFVTDGVVEARSPEGEGFGTQRTLDVVRFYRRGPAREIVENLYHAVRAYCRNEPQYDDITATVIKVGSPPGK